MSRAFDTVGMLIIAGILGVLAWFTLALVIGNMFTLLDSVNASLLLYTVGMSGFAELLTCGTAGAIIAAIMFATNNYLEFLTATDD